MDKQDSISGKNWKSSYEIKHSSTLWGDDYVPYINKSIEQFRTIKNARFFLDLPCGDGRNLSMLCEQLPVVVGADLSTTALQLASKRLATKTIENCLLHSCDVFDTQYVENQFDGIFCWDLLGHLVDVKLALSELLRVLKSGGLLIGSLFSTNDSTKNDAKMKPLSESQYEFIYDDKFYFKYYDITMIKELFKEFSVSVVEIKNVQWTEGPHENYREYVHDHESWAFILKKI